MTAEKSQKRKLQKARYRSPPKETENGERAPDLTLLPALSSPSADLSRPLTRHSLVGAKKALSDGWLGTKPFTSWEPSTCREGKEGGKEGRGGREGTRDGG